MKVNITDKQLFNLGFKKQGSMYYLSKFINKDNENGITFNMSLTEDFEDIKYGIYDYMLNKLTFKDLNDEDKNNFKEWFDKFKIKMNKGGIKI